MGRRGPAPKPTALKKAQGTYRPDRDSDAGAGLSDKLPYCPIWLSAPAKLEWRRVVKQLHGAGLIKQIDRTTLAAYCEAVGRWQDAITALDDEPMIYETDKGYRYPNPRVKQLESAKSEMLRWARELGLTPSARARIVVGDGGQAKTESIADQLMRRVKPE